MIFLCFECESGEAERIHNSHGRITAEKEDPDIHRVWVPDADYPGLAMSRSLGDFCLKDYGVISKPQISYRNLTRKDEFIVLATDGVGQLKHNKLFILSPLSILNSYHKFAGMGCVDEQASNQHSCISKEPIHGSEIGSETSCSRMETTISRVDDRRLCSDLRVLQEPTNVDEINDERGAAEREKPPRICSFKKL